jgi:ATP-binding cassette subfamily B protein
MAARGGGLGLALPALASLALGAQRLLPLAQTLNQAVTGLIANRRYLEDLARLLDGPEWVEPPKAEPLPFRDEVRLEGVRFTYPNADKPALDEVDLLLRRGERVALVGRNGAGKSSLADVVMGLLAPQAGRMLVDGRPLLPGDIPSWQRNIAHVPQAPFLADASIAANIAFMVEVPDLRRVAEAARIAGLGEIVSDLPKGLETRIGERGGLLSGGQRQRLALARALYAPAPLLVLDEATSALDPTSEQHVLAVLDELQARGTAILLIAHRATMLERCTRVIRLESGRIVP